MATDEWLVGWRDIGRYLGKSAKTAQRYAKDGMPVFRDPGGRGIMARRDLIDEYLIQVNRWINDSGGKKLSGLAEAIEMLDKKDRQTKEFEEKLLHAQRPLKDQGKMRRTHF